MKRNWLVVGISTGSMVLLILASLTNVVGYQTIQSSQQSVIKEVVNQRKLLFKPIVDIANIKEIQKEITIVPAYLKYAEKSQIVNIIKIFVGFILAVIMMTSALMFIPTMWTVILLLKLGILPRLEGYLEIAALILGGIAFFCWAIMPDEFWDWIYNLFPFLFKTRLLISGGDTCIPLK